MVEPAQTVHFSTLDRIIFRQHIDRHWSRVLNGAEFKLVSHIFDRTYAWGNVTEQISIREFATGRTNYTAGTGLSKRTIYRAIASLSDRGFIGYDSERGFRSTYAVNMFRSGHDDGVKEFSWPNPPKAK